MAIARTCFYAVIRVVDCMTSVTALTLILIGFIVYSNLTKKPYYMSTEDTPQPRARVVSRHTKSSRKKDANPKSESVTVAETNTSRAQESDRLRKQLTAIAPGSKKSSESSSKKSTVKGRDRSESDPTSDRPRFKAMKEVFPRMTKKASTLLAPRPEQTDQKVKEEADGVEKKKTVQGQSKAVGGIFKPLQKNTIKAIKSNAINC
ncbi:hypothetical protein PNOK_0303400 [Pyrrhoderma noxium]|uniref:Uncharacterized protein n=1 Tax=Pyrrhoderma noxium TaxID=2282107 RepID=A0A286ULB6_9AGAM|nr:hypothetical protein PNOK_0303400 [Pyrrhoderma noxium]